ncbi:membrane protein [Asanoa ishikariensis]|uniref:Probable cobalt transporter subunit (CbtA) n=1 Tax=Asanoa ishikariensis TaxID=137265 RepID=A0A1H3S0I8_9ACTN|nr:CbtA family protein [Asanoa ishikariensis]GIF66655.1 membrane protein [Asanoa ishikariensis]SDZ31075.1 Probable cobalt transporter subunit (CbtA) [Asanoa ishikariensis]
MLSPRSLLIRGMLVGLAAGVLAFVFAYLVGESPIDAAIAFEEAHADPAAAGEPALVSRTVQSTVGLLTATLIYGVALGGIFSMAFAAAYGRLGQLGPRATAALVALAGFVVVALVPFLKYPANPPATGSEDTIGRRTSLYFLMLVIALASLALAIYIGRSQVARFGLWNAAIIAAGAFVAVIVVAHVLLPSIEEIPEGFSPIVLWNFRLASLGTQVVVWTALGLGLGAVVERSLRREAVLTASA